MNITGEMGIISLADVTGEIQQIFAEITRYPLEILDFDADLETDLGIDSVKLGEVFSVLRERYNLPLEMDIPREQLSSIAGISLALSQYLSNPEVNALPQVKLDAGIKSNAVEGRTEQAGRIVQSNSVSLVDLTGEVQQIFAEITRYPLEILDFDADLETDLGIDSVKLGEVFSVLREKYDLPLEMDIPREQLNSIAGISLALSHYLSHPEARALPQAKPEASIKPQAANVRVERAVNIDAISNSFAGLNPEHKPLAGKVALVTGSGRGLGKEIATYLASLGASIVVNSFHSREAGDATLKEIKANGGDGIHVWGSMAKPDHINNLFDQIEQEYGGLDFYVANASNGMLGRLENITTEHWEKAFRTNVAGLHQCALRSVKLMRKRGGGKIITLSSPASHGYVDYFGCMGAVKAAVESLTRSMAIEFSADNVQVNCISPGPIYGDLLNKWPESERLIAQWEGNTAYERLCEVQDVSHFIAYLLSAPVRLFNGSVLVMDGGISISGF